MYVGVDTAKRTLELRDLDEAAGFCVSNTQVGFAELLERWRGLEGRLVVGVEPSGGYERGLVRALLDAGIDVRWCDPVRVRALARAFGAPAKTDELDAEMIARYVAQVGGSAVVDDVERAELRDLLSARTAAQESAQRLEAQAQGLTNNRARETLEALAGHARLEVKALTQAVGDFLRQSPRLLAPWRLLQTAPGVGPLVAAELLATMPELGCVSNKVIAKLAGLAPFIRKSGAWQGKATCSGGRPRPRRILYMAAMAALRAKQGLRRRFEHLVANGKPKKVALTACMRSLLVALNAMLRDKTPWQTAQP
jgi:transposase